MKKQTKKAVKKAAPLPKAELVHELRIPTDMYAYLNIQFCGSPEEAFAEYQRLTAMVKGGAGLERKDFIKILDEYIATKQLSGDPGLVEQMSLDQQLVINEIRKSFTRIK
jgi:hypothetical protein